jgi:hypothetical protein
MLMYLFRKEQGTLIMDSNRIGIYLKKAEIEERIEGNRGTNKIF